MQGTYMQSEGIFDLLTSNQDPDTLFELLTLIGEGAFGAVWKVLHKSTGTIYATKILPLSEGLETIINEISVLKECKSPYIIGYFGSYLKGDKLWLVMEYCAAGSAADIMRATKNPFNEMQIATILAMVLKGLDYLHSSKKIHRDIKAGNVLIDASGNVKLADFGVAAHKLLTISDPCDTVTGTPFWMSPEVIAENKYGKKTDIWSLGITAIELAEMEPPYSHIHPFRAMYVIKNRPAQGLTHPEQWSAEFNNFVKRCLTINPKERPTAKELLQDEFIAKARGNGILCELVANSLDLIEEYRLENATHEKKKKNKHDISFVEGSIIDDNMGSETEFPDDNQSAGTMIVNETLNATTGTVVVHNNDSVQNTTMIIHNNEEVLNETMIRHPTIDMKGKEDDQLIFNQQLENLLNGEEEKSSRVISSNTNNMLYRSDLSEKRNLESNKKDKKPIDQGPRQRQIVNMKKDAQGNLPTKQVSPNMDQNTPISKNASLIKEKSSKIKKIEKVPPEYKGLSSISIQNKIKSLEKDLEIEIMMIKQSYYERIKKLQHTLMVVRAEEEGKELKKHQDDASKNLGHASRQIQSEQKSRQQGKPNLNAQPVKQTQNSQSPRPHAHVNADESLTRSSQRLPRQVDERAIKTGTSRNDHFESGIRNHLPFAKPELSPSSFHKGDSSPNRMVDESNSQNSSSTKASSGSKISVLANKNSQPHRNEKGNNHTNARGGMYINYGGSPSERSPDHSNTSNDNSKITNSTQETNQQKYSFHFAPLLNESPAIKGNGSKNKTGQHSALNVSDSFHNQPTPTVSYSIANLSPKQPSKAKQQINSSYENRSEKKSIRLDLKPEVGTEAAGACEGQKASSKNLISRAIPKNEISVGSVEDYSFNVKGGRVNPTAGPTQQGGSKAQISPTQNSINEGAVNPVQALLKRKY